MEKLEITESSRSSSESQLTIIRPKKGWRWTDLNELWAFRELLWVLTARDVKVRYKQTVLGFAWAIIQPVMLMVVFSIFFGRLAKMPSDGYPYPIFVYAGLLPWTFFATSISSSGGSLVGSAQLVSKVYFPRLIIPMASVGSGLIDFAIAAVVLLVLMLYYGLGLTWNLLMLPLLVAALILVALGVGTLLSATTVAYRDFRYVIPFLVQIWLFITPVVYPTSIVPEDWRWLLNLNPMVGIIEGFRSAFLGSPFDIIALVTSLIVGAALFAIGIAYFEKVERRLADII